MARTMLCLCMILVALDTSAERTAFACQTLEIGGLQWAGSRWNLASYNDNKFVLVVKDGRLTTESVAGTFGLPNANFTCSPVLEGGSGNFQMYVCNDRFGAALVFDGKTMEGGYSALFGAVASQPLGSRDSIFVAPFKCSQF